MRVLSFFPLASSVFCFCRSLFSVSFRSLMVCRMRKMQGFWYDFTRVDVNVNVVVTKKNSFSVCAKAGFVFSPAR